MKKLFLVAAALMVLIAFASLVVSCGSSNSPSSPAATATPTAAPASFYSSAPTTVASGGSPLQPYGIAYDSFSGSGNIWFVTNANPGYLYQYTTAGSLVTSTDIYTGTSKYKYPVCVRADPAGYLYVSDDSNNQIEVLTPSGGYVGLGPTVTSPLDMVVNAAGTTLYVLENTGPYITILTYSITGTGYPKTFTSTLNSFPNGSGGTFDPAEATSLALDSNGNVYLCSYTGEEILKYSPTGASPVIFAVAASAVPWGAAIDSSGNLFATEQTTGIQFVQEFSSTGSAEVSIGGFAPNANLTGITADGSGNLYVADSYNGNIYKIKK